MAKRGAPKWKQFASKLGIIAGVLALLWFAVEGGEYGTFEVFQQHARRQALEQEVVALKADVDSLEREKLLLLKNDVVLERIAREEYGMLRGSKELLFWTNNPGARKDSTADARATASRR